MNLNKLVAKLFCLGLFLSPFSLLNAKTVEEMQKDGWQLTFSDEFNGSSLDASKWVLHYRFDDIINHELQAYIPDAITVTNGELHITAKHESAVQHGQTQAYTSGAMTTSGKFSQQYGYFEMRCKLPRGKGFWPAFWLLSDTGKWPPEIDIFENIGLEEHKLHFTNHWPDENGHNKAKSQDSDGPDYTADYHLIAVDWQPDKIIWYVDGNEQCRVTEHIPQEKMYVLVNLAVGGDWPKAPDELTPFPSSLDVDYVRVYQRTNPAP